MLFSMEANGHVLLTTLRILTDTGCVLLPNAFSA